MMTMQVVYNPSDNLSAAAGTTASITARKNAAQVVRGSHRYQQRQLQKAMSCTDVAALPAALCRVYQHDGDAVKGLFSLASGRFDGATGGCHTTTTNGNN